MVRTTCVFLLNMVAVRAAMEAYIVGGDFAQIVHHPHAVFLNIICNESDNKRPMWICSGSILNQMLLLSAGHCLHGCNSYSHIIIHLGDEDKQKGKVCSAYSFVIHEDYDPTSSSNDISLIRVDMTLPLNSKMSRVALMKRPPYSEKAKVAGWGMVDEVSETQSDKLKYVSQMVKSRDECLNIFGYLPRGTFCAASEVSNDEYVAKGDSGAALLVRGYIQIGLVSYKIPPTSRNVVVYTDVGYFYNWIKRNSKSLFCL